MAEPKQPRGFAAMPKEKLIELARQGGRAVADAGTGHRFTSDEAREAGRKGGAIAAQDREHMRRIARLGGKARKGFKERAARGPLPPVSVLPAPSDDEWDPDLGTVGTPITGDEDA